MQLSRSQKLGLFIAGLSLAAVGQAQTVYRIVGADGRVTFSDKPPVTAEKGKVAATTLAGSSGASVAGLPFELRQVVGKYPVTLYTAKECSPCNSARTLLSSRGIPFAERTVSTSEDFDALKRLVGDNSVPVLSIGAQRLKGFSDVEWTQYLDAAGYPPTSMLPASYRQAPASPLVALAEPPAAEKPAAKPVDEPRAPSGPGPSNPAGIQF
jgi:glutaredoxin